MCSSDLFKFIKGRKGERRILEEGEKILALQEVKQGIAKTKRNSWSRGNGPCSARGELRGGISKYKKILNRKVRRRPKVLLQNADYKKICKTGMMVDFT